MGQYWKVVNLDKRQTHGDWGKLGECLFDGSPDHLVNNLLRVIIEILPLPPKNQRVSLTSTLPSNCFSRLPDELIGYFFDTLRPCDCIYLAVTSERCWLIGQKHVTAHLPALLNSWAGDRIMCVGDYVRDVPPGVLTAEEEKELREHPSNNKHCDNSDLDEDDEDDENDDNITEGSKTLYSLGYSRLSGRNRWNSLLTAAEIKRFWSLVNVKTPECSILRNLSRHEYVRYDALEQLKDQSPETWQLEEVGFGEVVLSRICWSSDSSVSMAYDQGIHRGKWAGDRFDITSAGRLEVEDENRQRVEWKDVSKEVMEEIGAIWKSEYDH